MYIAIAQLESFKGKYFCLGLPSGACVCRRTLYLVSLITGCTGVRICFDVLNQIGPRNSISLCSLSVIQLFFYNNMISRMLLDVIWMYGYVLSGKLSIHISLVPMGLSRYKCLLDFVCIFIPYLHSAIQYQNLTTVWDVKINDERKI